MSILNRAWLAMEGILITFIDLGVAPVMNQYRKHNCQGQNYVCMLKTCMLFVSLSIKDINN